jgi:hypothetical protein
MDCRWRDPANHKYTNASKKGGYKEQNGRTHLQEDKKKPPKSVNHKGEHLVFNPFLSWEAYQIKKGEDLLKGCLA